MTATKITTKAAVAMILASGAVSGTPVTEKARRIAMAYAGQQAYVFEIGRSEGHSELYKGAVAVLVRLRRNYDYYNWRA
jgi:hypothetical protein